MPEAAWAPAADPPKKEDEFGTLTWGAATAFEDDLSSLILRTKRFAAMGCSEGNMVLKPAGGGPSRGMAGNYCKFAKEIAGAARADFAIGATNGVAPNEILEDKASEAVEAVILAGGKSKIVRLETHPPLKNDAQHKGARPSAEALAAAVGDKLAGAVWRLNRGGGAKELHLARVDRNGAKVGHVDVLDKGQVGAATIAFDGDTLYAMWASRSSDKDPYVLKWTKVAGTGSPEPPQALTTSASSFAPGLSVQDSRFLLAWMEGDEKSGKVRVGASKKDLASAVGQAVVVSNTGMNARDPEVAQDKQGNLFVVWQEFAPGKRETRATALKCGD
jgi:hypothetical protein